MGCLVETTGSCRGCNVAAIAEERIRQGESLEKAVAQISAELCPEGLQVQEDAVKQEKLPLWGTPTAGHLKPETVACWGAGEGENWGP